MDVDMDRAKGPDLQQTVAMLKRGWRRIAAITILATLATAGLNFLVIPPVYEAATSVIVGQGGTDQGPLQYDAVMMYQKLTRTYLEIARSKRVLAEMAQRLGGVLSERQLEKMVNATTLEGTQIVILKARSPWRDEALAVANALTDSFIRESQRVYPMAKIQILDPAELPKKPVQPHSVVNTVTACLLAFIAGLGLTLARETLCDTLRTAGDVERELRLPVLGVIPWAAAQRKLKGPGPAVQQCPDSRLSEAYRILRTRLGFAGTGRPVKTLLVVSAAPGEGKTAVAKNLAWVIAQTGRNVLLLDGDLRQPGRTGDKGLSHLLLGQYGNQTMKQVAANLYLFPAGGAPANPSELLLSPFMKDFVAKSRAAFDYVIIDSPALAGISDAQILATLADGVLLVIAAGESRIEAVREAKEQLLNVQANLIGAVLNKSKAG